ncbi:hypothetical protein [Brachybacterium sp. UMB0905]|uniref:hypothetical protein n=1 Tax=Brachybacterium sp. UMB0905 TaxID=2069310 RepID=UPI000C80ACF9|nr:hypothetical protein [Brachybacterium sp. UMB0905]PMC74865.1 hypothetical protein CJ197_11265 [Brachybacterium sp. UMB0905]
MAATPPRPSPRDLAGRIDPARRVTPVDYTAVPRPGSAEPQNTPEKAPAPSTPSGPLPRRSPSGPLPRRRARTIELPRRAPSAPSEALVTLDADDPRPVPRPLRIDDGEIRVVGIQTLEREQVVLTVADPEDAWSADAGASDHFLRGPLVVQVRRVDNAVIGAFSRAYALSVRPTEVERSLAIAEDAAGRSARGGRGTRHPTSRRELLERMEQAGFVVRAGSTHGRVTHPEHPGLFVPFASTPSDRRFTRHAVAQIRRVFGIDLRH